MKVLQSIASVIQALPAEQEIPPVEVTKVPFVIIASNRSNIILCRLLLLQ
jgi:hypothetical protein